MKIPVLARINIIAEAVNTLDPHRKLVAMIVLVMPVTAVLAALEPLLYKLVFDRLLSDIGVFNVLLALGAVATTSTMREVLTGCADWLSWRLGLTVNYQLSGAVLPGALFTHSPPGAAADKSGNNHSRGIRGFTAALSELAFGLLPGVVFLVIASVAMYTLDWRLTLVVLFLATLPLIKSSAGRLGTPVALAAAIPAQGTLLCCGLFLFLRGETTVGTVMAFFCYQLGMSAPVASVTRIFRTLRIATSFTHTRTIA